MRLKSRLALLILILLPFCLQAQVSPSSKTPRILFLLDGSSSMSEDWGAGKSRFQQAGKFILALMDSLSEANTQVEFGLRVFGHQYPAQNKNCFDTKREVMFSRDNSSQMAARIESLRGYGVSPIAFSLSEAALEDFENESKYAYSIILVTDGGESCDGDICKVVNDLLKRKIFFRPYIVSLLDYAPLKDLYKCLGTFLTVSKEPEMPKAITTIVDAHREGFERAKTGKVISVLDIPKKVDTVATPIKKEIVITKPLEPVKKDTTPIPIRLNPEPKKIVVKELPKKDTIVTPVKIKTEPVKPIEPPIVLQVRDKKEIKALRLKTKLKAYKTIERIIPNPKPVDIPGFALSKVGDAPPIPIVKVVIPERKKEKEIAPLKFAKRRPFKTTLAVLPKPKKIVVPPFVLSKMEEPVVAINPDTIVIPITIKKEESKTIIKPVIKPIVKTEKPVIKQAKQNIYKVETIPAQETQVEIYFTDGNGKYYTTAPQIVLADPITGKSVNTFYRTVNPEGKPDPLKLVAGKFNLSVVGSEQTFLKEIEIVPNMKNKIEIVVTNGTLQFVWANKANKKPVDKFMAVVKRNFVPQPNVNQRCDTILQYAPGNYHLEINTLPVSVLSTDLTFGATTVLQIEEPGTIKILNGNNIGKANFYYPHGGRYEQFFSMNVTGNTAIQKAEFQPGVYEVHYSIASGLPDKIQKFYLRSNEIVELDLK